MNTQAVTTPNVESIRRIVSLGGETEERRAGRKAVAESHVEITLNTDNDATTCLAKLEESDRRLAEKMHPAGGTDSRNYRRWRLTAGFGRTWTPRVVDTPAGAR
ncbi:hypothetical protein [Nocardia sp. NPDC051463]|uniref:hypothetical protein n=1 Tax=Nocardia sp. NPDC051463 TaxID=3154845 RepID=UPI00344FFCE0